MRKSINFAPVAPDS